MESLFILIPIALFFLLLAVLIFFWAVKSGQFEDFDTEARRILFDDDVQPSQSKAHSSTAKNPHQRTDDA